MLNEMLLYRLLN